MKTRRNPDFFMDVLTIGVLGLGGVWVVNQINHAAQQVSNTVPNAIDSIGGSIASAPSKAINSITYGNNPPGTPAYDNSLCTAINYWRQTVAPGTYIFGALVPGTQHDPHDWNAFTDWLHQTGAIGVPGVTTFLGVPSSPPGCW